MKTSTKIISAGIVLCSFYYFYRGTPSVPPHDAEPKDRAAKNVTSPRSQADGNARDYSAPSTSAESSYSASSTSAAVPPSSAPTPAKFKVHPSMNPQTAGQSDNSQDSEPSPEGDPSPENVLIPSGSGANVVEHAEPGKLDNQSDSEVEGQLNEKIAADARVQRVADILSVNCQAATCVVRAQAKPDLEQEVQMAFILFQKEHPEFGTNFRMEPNPDDPSINNFVYTKENVQQAPNQMDPISSNPPNTPAVTR